MSCSRCCFFCFFSSMMDHYPLGQRLYTVLHDLKQSPFDSNDDDDDGGDNNNHNSSKNSDNPCPL